MNPTVRRWRQIGTWVEVLGPDEVRTAAAAERVRQLLADLDQACSRFRPDSELRQVPPDLPVTVGPVLHAALSAALRTAELTDGLVDPTVGATLAALGYDADLDLVRARPHTAPAARVRIPGYRAIAYDAANRRLVLFAGVELDLGASAKAWAADAAAAACAAELDGSFLVNLGGDLALAGPAPAQGWRVQVDSGDAAGPEDGALRPVVVLRSGALATSSTSARTWTVDGRTRHHIVDPRTGLPAARVWRAVTVAADRCELANAATTAAIILGAEAPAWLRRRGLHARLVSARGRVVLVGDWPAESHGSDGRSGERSAYERMADGKMTVRVA